MTFLSGLLTRNLEDPTRPLTDASLLSYIGGEPTKSGIQVTPQKALQVGAAFRGTQIIAGSVAGLPLRVYRRSNASPVTSSVVTNDGFYTPFERWETTVAHMVLWGNAYLFMQKDAAGRVLSLMPVHPSRIRIEVEDPPGMLADRVPFVKKFILDDKKNFTDYEILHIPCMSLDGVRGLGPIGYTREMFGLAVSAEQAAATMYSNGMMLSGVLTTDQQLTESQAETVKRRWKAKHQGVGNANDIAVLDSGARFTPLGMPPADAQFLESRKFQVTEIARLLGVPGWMMNDQEKSTSWGSGMEQQFTAFVILTLKPYTQRIEQRITRVILPDSQYAEFKVEGLLRGDSRSRAAFYASGIQHGWLVPNDVRRLENMPLVEWGDEPYLPFNQSAADERPDPPPSEEDEE